MPVPVVILTGYLGSGKTTLLNNLLKQTSGKRVAVFENEFALEYGIEMELLSEKDQVKVNLQEIYDFGGGCVCCSLSGEFRASLAQISPEETDLVLVELTGVADPRPVAGFFADPELSHLELAAVICVVDAKNFRFYLRDEDTVRNGESLTLEATAQLKGADVVLLNKMDLVSAESAAELKQLLHQHTAAPIVEATLARETPPLASLMVGHTASAESLVLHDIKLKNTCVTTSKFLSEAAVTAWLRQVQQQQLILRVKGLIRLASAPDEVWLVQGVLHDLTWSRLRSLTPDEANFVSRIVLIGHDFSDVALQAQFSQLAA